MTDSTTLQSNVAKAERFDVDPALCIACDACCQDFPEIFYMGQDAKAHSRDQHDSALYNARTVVDVCPTSAISFTGELPPAEDLSKLEEVPGWELEWAKWRGVEMDPVERDRRYGRDYRVTEEEDLVRIVVQFPTRVPAVRDRFRYGLTDVMPIYGQHVVQDGNVFQVYGWVKDPKIRALTHTTSSFPGQFLTTIELQRTTFGHAARFDGHQRLEIVVFKKPGLAEGWRWRSHFITEKCTACTICERVCPTNAISGGERFYIDPDLCINCSVCGIYCPFDAINNDRDRLVTHIKPKQVPKALVHEELCTGCEFCVDVCPFEAIEMRNLVEPGPYELPQTSRVASVIEKNCTSCKLCEQVCIKDAIEIPRVQKFRDIGMSFMNYLEDGH
jgi:Na+-translocating ferredoxin:NAD+ oxidoreductase subunit B